MRSASITATITGNGPERWIRADVTVRPGIPQFAIHGVCEATAVEMRRITKAALEKRGYSLPSLSITADVDLAVPFEGIVEISFTLAIALLVATEQIVQDSLAEKALAPSSAGECIHLRCQPV